MRIAQIAPLTEAIPPELYGGTERVVSWLTEELVALGHDVTLFASGNSRTSAKLEAMWPRALRLDDTVRDPMALHIAMLERVRRLAAKFDVLHFHLDYLPFSVFSRQATPFITTMHGRLDLPEHQTVFNAFGSVPVISISDMQRKPVPQARWMKTIYHGLPADLLAPRPCKARIPRLPRSHCTGEVGRSGNPHRRGGGAAAEDRRQGRPRRSRLFRAGHPAAARPAGHRVHRRDRRCAEVGVPGRRAWRCSCPSTGPSRSAW